MSQLDDELRTALAREEPPAGFADRVLARLPAEAPTAAAARRVAPRTWLAAAAAFGLATSGVWLMLPRAPGVERVGLVQPTPLARPDPPAPTAKPDPPPAPKGDPPTTAPAPSKRTPRPVPRRTRDDAEALHAAEQLRTAIGVTSDKLRLTQREVREALVVPES